MIDSHIHTEFSTDSTMKIEEVIMQIETRGLEKAIITDHMDLDFPKDDTLFKFNVDEYFNQYSQYRDKIGLGIEIGMKVNVKDKINQILHDNQFDFVIGSVHLVDNIDIYDKEFYKNKTKQEAYEEYLNTILECISDFKNYDSLGHIDYICRYSIYDDREIYYREFNYYIDKILKIIIDEDKSIELNTRRLDNKYAYENLFEIYSRYKNLGGRFVTIGSDAHNKEAVGNNFEKANEIINLLGLTETTYKSRKKQY